MPANKTEPGGDSASCATCPKNLSSASDANKSRPGDGAKRSGATWLRERDVIATQQAAAAAAAATAAATAAAATAGLPAQAVTETPWTVGLEGPVTALGYASGSSAAGAGQAASYDSAAKATSAHVADQISAQIAAQQAVQQTASTIQSMLAAAGPRPPEKWGPRTWAYMHEKSLAFPENPTEEEKNRWRQWVTTVASNIDCPTCSEHMLKEIDTGVEQAMVNKATFVTWLIDVHNRVNAKAGKRELSYEESLRAMLNPWSRPAGGCPACPGADELAKAKASAKKAKAERDAVPTPWLIAVIVLAVLCLGALAYGVWAHRRANRSEAQQPDAAQPQKLTVLGTVQGGIQAAGDTLRSLIPSALTSKVPLSHREAKRARKAAKKAKREKKARRAARKLSV